MKTTDEKYQYLVDALKCLYSRPPQELLLECNTDLEHAYQWYIFIILYNIGEVEFNTNNCTFKVGK